MGARALAIAIGAALVTILNRFISITAGKVRGGYAIEMSMDNDPLQWFKRLVESQKSVRLGSGVIGKTTQAVLADIALWVGIVWKMSDSLVQNVALVLVGVIATGVLIWWIRKTHQFAKDNPAQAMLEGAQFVEYKRFEAQIKGCNALPNAPKITDPSRPFTPDSLSDEGER